MTPDMVMTIARQALWMAVLLAALPLLTALLVGLIVGLFQAATQINEMTLSFIPKLLAVAAVFAMAGPWMLRLIIDFTRELIHSIPSLLG